jgi:ABC-type lipoprotein export system ATPase subunit
VTATPVVALEQVSKAFCQGGNVTPVLRAVDFAIRPGEKASLIGPSGSGKSTLLSLIAGLLQPDEGTVYIDGATTVDLDDGERSRLRADRIGIALQADNLIPFLSARENVELALAFGARRPRRVARSRALELLDRFGVKHRADHRPRQISGGESQRVALAVSMANDPTLMLADEVVAQLDADTAKHVLQEVLAADFAVLYVTHDVALADLAERRYTIVDYGVRLR